MAAGPGLPRVQLPYLSKMERLVLSMQDPHQGVKMQHQRLRVTTAPHTVTGYAVVQWLVRKYLVTEAEALHLGSLLLCHGFLYSLRPPCGPRLHAESLYRFQTPYFWTSTSWPVADLDYAIYLAKKSIQKRGALLSHEKEDCDRLHGRLSHLWDLVGSQAREQLRAAMCRRKVDRLVVACQEQAFWLVVRPPPGAPNVLEQGPERGRSTRPVRMTGPVDFYRQEVERLRAALGRVHVKSSVCLEAFLRFSGQHGPHDPIMAGCLPSNPWVTGDTTYWAVNAPSVAAPTRLRVERWALSFWELLGDPVGRARFMDFLQTEFSAENLSFWEACEELRHGGQAQLPSLVDTVYHQFLAPGAAHWVNIDSRTLERTLAGLQRPHRHVLDDAQMHIYMLMKKDTYPRFLKSELYKTLLTDAVVPPETKRALPALLRSPHSSPSPAHASGGLEAAARGLGSVSGSGEA